jgi:hypothetical protein
MARWKAGKDAMRLPWLHVASMPLSLPVCCPQASSERADICAAGRLADRNVHDCRFAWLIDMCMVVGYRYLVQIVLTCMVVGYHYRLSLPSCILCFG